MCLFSLTCSWPYWVQVTSSKQSFMSFGDNISCFVLFFKDLVMLFGSVLCVHYLVAGLDLAGDPSYSSVLKVFLFRVKSTAPGRILVNGACSQWEVTVENTCMFSTRERWTRVAFMNLQWYYPGGSRSWWSQANVGTDSRSTISYLSNLASLLSFLTWKMQVLLTY